MSLLLRNYRIHTRYGGGFVAGIGGVESGEAGGRPYDWFYYVNGVEAQKGAAATDVHSGDRVWWDLHDWSATQDVPAVVGAYPEPFLHGIGGKRFPVRVECTRDAGAACATVTARLQQAGVPAATAALGAGAGPKLLRVLVGPWREVRADRELQAIESGPRASGVYARPNAAGSTIALLDEDGRPARTLGARTGLIAATAGQERVPPGRSRAPTRRVSRSPRTRSAKRRCATVSRWPSPRRARSRRRWRRERARRRRAYRLPAPREPASRRAGDGRRRLRRRPRPGRAPARKPAAALLPCSPPSCSRRRPPASAASSWAPPARPCCRCSRPPCSSTCSSTAAASRSSRGWANGGCSGR